MDNEEWRLRVVAEALSWQRTKFRHRARIKGRNGGVDCAGVLLETYEHTGCVPHIEPSAYVMQAMLHDRKERFVEVLEKFGREIPESEAKAGDAVIYLAGRSYSHGGILIENWPGNIVHAVVGLGVIQSHGTKDGFLKSRKRRFFTMNKKDAA